MLSSEDTIRLRHMLEAAQTAIDFIGSHTRPDLDNDRQLAFALVRAIEVVGEAASKVTEAGRAEFPDIPWPDIVGMRNRIIHAYYDIDLDRVWDTVKVDLPVLILDLEKALPKE